MVLPQRSQVTSTEPPDFKFQQHKAVFPVEGQLDIRLAIAEILLLVGLKELVVYLVIVFMNARLQSHKCNIKIPATHGYELLKVGKGREKIEIIGCKGNKLWGKGVKIQWIEALY